MEHSSNTARDCGLSKLLSCDYCNRVFYSSAGLVKHMQSHKGKDVHKAINMLCSGKYTRNRPLTNFYDQHIRTNTGELV